MPVDRSQQLRLEPAVGQLVWQAWSEVQCATHMFPPPVLVLAVPAVPDVPVVPVVSGLAPVDVSIVAPLEEAPPTPLPPTPPVVSLPDAHAPNAAGVNRAKTTKVMLACFTGL
jgi:hypothetical protein